MQIIELYTLKASFHSGKLSVPVDWNGQENFSLC
jgi:hypothetical protein